MGVSSSVHRGARGLLVPGHGRARLIRVMPVVVPGSRPPSVRTVWPHRRPAAGRCRWPGRRHVVTVAQERETLRTGRACLPGHAAHSCSSSGQGRWACRQVPLAGRHLQGFRECSDPGGLSFSRAPLATVFLVVGTMEHLRASPLAASSTRSSACRPENLPGPDG